jgi:predicted nucleic acid-binding protein
VNFLLACGWSSQARHTAARAWLEARASFTTSPLSEPGFIRVSMTPADRASFADAQSALLVGLARAHGLKMAALDDALCGKPWAADAAENPLGG